MENKGNYGNLKGDTMYSECFNEGNNRFIVTDYNDGCDFLYIVESIDSCIDFSIVMTGDPEECEEWARKFILEQISMGKKNDTIIIDPEKKLKLLYAKEVLKFAIELYYTYDVKSRFVKNMKQARKLENEIFELSNVANKIHLEEKYIPVVEKYCKFADNITWRTGLDIKNHFKNKGIHTKILEQIT